METMPQKHARNVHKVLSDALEKGFNHEDSSHLSGWTVNENFGRSNYDMSVSRASCTTNKITKWDIDIVVGPLTLLSNLFYHFVYCESLIPFLMKYNWLLKQSFMW